MGKLKTAVLNQDKPEESKTFDLTEYEMMYINRLNAEKNTLNTFISGFLSYIAGTRLGYKTGSDLQFEVDFDKKQVIIRPFTAPAPATPEQTDQ